MIPAAVLALSLLAQPSQEREPPAPFPIAAAGWCVLQDRSEASLAEAPEESEAVETDETVNRSGATPGCDLGVAASLYRFKRPPRLSVIAAIGTETLGAGLGWLIHRTEAGTAYGVALGAVAPWGPEGIDVSEWGLALGATLSLTRRRSD